MSASLRVDAAAEQRLRSEAAGRALVIDFFAARCCTGVVAGDLMTRWADEPGADAVEIGAVAGTRLLADRRLVEVLAEGASLVESGPFFARSIGVRLARPECWIDFLDSPAARRRRRVPAG